MSKRAEPWFQLDHEPIGPGTPMTSEERKQHIELMREMLRTQEANYAEHGRPDVITLDQFLYTDWFGPQFYHSS